MGRDEIVSVWVFPRLILFKVALLALMLASIDVLF